MDWNGFYKEDFCVLVEQHEVQEFLDACAENGYTWQDFTGGSLVDEPTYPRSGSFCLYGNYGNLQYADAGWANANAYQYPIIPFTDLNLARENEEQLDSGGIDLLLNL